jgi:hypothetical protein
MKTRLALALLVTTCLSLPARADLHQRFVWLQGAQPGGFASATADIDDEARSVSVLADTHGLSSSVINARLVDANGQTVIAFNTLSVTPTFAFMTASLPQVVIDQVLLAQTRVVLGTVQNPLGEIDGEIPVNLDLSVNFELSPQQLSPPAISNASGTGYALVGIDGATAFSGLLTNLQGTLTSIEIHRGAWLGQQGTLLLLVNAIGNPNPSTISFNAFLPKPEADVHRDLHDGMCYVIVRTLESPQGELRGQIRNLRRGDRYCKGRPNSVSQAGASLEMYGSPLASDNDVQLQGRDLPPGKVVLPILSCFYLLDSYARSSGVEPADFYVGKTLVVVGRSTSVGKPAQWLGLERHATVIAAHSRTASSGRLAEATSQADILIVAAGRPGLVTGEMVREGVIAVDVGFHAVPGKDGGPTRFTGDLDFDSVAAKAEAITPVPGGVGPITDVWLVGNTLVAAALSARVEPRFGSAI